VKARLSASKWNFLLMAAQSSSRLTAGYTASIGQIIPIVWTPLVGLFFDRFGRRVYFISITAALWVLVFSLLAYSDVHPLAP
jgi:MFS family permease